MHLPTFGLFFQEATESQVRHITQGATCCPTGVYVYSVLPDSPAARANIQRGDLICAFEGAQIDNTGEVQVAWNYQKVQLEHVLHRASDMTRDYKFSVFKAQAPACVDVMLRPEVITRNGLNKLFPPYDPVPYLVLMGVCMMPLARNHVEIPQTIASYASLKPDELAQPVLIITYIFNGTAAQRTESLMVGDFVSKVNNVDVKTLDDARAAFMTPLPDGTLSIEVQKGRSLVLSVREVLEQEAVHARFEPPLYNPATEVLEALQKTQPVN